MNERETMVGALRKLDWIARLAVRNRYRGFPAEWFEKTNPSDKSDLSDETDRSGGGASAARLDPYGIALASPETAANTLLCLINQAIYLLKRQIQRMERDFAEQGGFTEKLYRVRYQQRRQP